MSASTPNSIQFHSRASDVAQPVTHSALDFFEKPSVLINYEGSHDQEVFPQVGCRGPQLDFVVTSDNRNLVDLNKIVLDIDCAIYKGPVHRWENACRRSSSCMFCKQHAT